jgi:hypothetical protein
MVCDNDGLYSNTMQWDDTGTHYGVMILFEAEDDINSGRIIGAVLEGCPNASDDTGTDITMSGGSTICYNPTIINNIDIASLKTTTVAAVPGTVEEIAGDSPDGWDRLSLHEAIPAGNLPSWIEGSELQSREQLAVVFDLGHVGQMRARGAHHATGSPCGDPCGGERAHRVPASPARRPFSPEHVAER